MLNHAVILITGAGKGIGAAFTRALIHRKKDFPGLKLFLTSRTESDLLRLKTLASENQVSCEILALDYTEHPVQVVEECVKKWGRIDALVHSAGVGRFGDFLSLTRQDLEFVMKNNVHASFELMQATYRQMKNQSASQSARHLRGQIQWITSVAAEKAFPQSAVYCMSKFAQRGLIEVMRQIASADSIRILEVQPGATYTPMWGEISPEMIKKMMSAEDVALPMVEALLMSEQASLEVLRLRPLGGDL